MPDKQPDKDQQPDLEAVIDRAVQQAVSAVRGQDDPDDDKPADPPPEQEPDYNELFAEGRYDEAVAAMKRAAVKEAAKLSGPALYAAHQTAKQLARQRLGERFDRWHERAVELAKSYGIDPSAWITVEDWERAIKHAMAQDIDAVIEEERKRAREEAARELAAGTLAAGSVGEDIRDVWSKLPDEAKQVARDIGWSPETVAKHWEIIDRHSAPDGSITDVSVLDEDVRFNEDKEGIEIEPGRF